VAECYPESIAIAGAWGYIGRKFLEAARTLRLRTLVYDPHPAPPDLDLRGVTRVGSESEFYRQSADLFHLALHPEHRQTGMDILLARGWREPLLVLCEKPMAAPERPEQCREVLAAVERSRAVVLYDFPELFDPITARIREFLAGFRRVSLDAIQVQRSKDREDPAHPRNYKRMVTIQYQESVHCLAFVLHLLAAVKGSLAAALADGLSVTARSAPYEPPNPEAYPRAVDGRCEYELVLGSTAVSGRTDFKRGAEWAKRRIIRGTGDGRPFRIEADLLEGRKRLIINERSQDDVVATNSYAEGIRACGAWYRGVPAEELMHGLYPHPAFAHVAYQLSSVLWRSCQDQRTVTLASLATLLDFDADFP
jgi:predicted dehydrogenase